MSDVDRAIRDYLGFHWFIDVPVMVHGQVLGALAFAGPTEISTVANIALDRRHNTKVLYKELERRALLSGRGRLFILGDQGLIFRFFKSINLRSRYAHRG